MKRCKKLVICLLAVMVILLCFSALPERAYAATPDDLKFELDSTGTGYTIVGCNKESGGELVIPETYNGKPVISIGYGAFSHWTGLTSVVISDSITGIGAKAFENCSNLTSITLGTGVESFGQNAFEGCDNLIELKVKEGNTLYHSAGNCIIRTDIKSLARGCKTSQIPTDGSVTQIAISAFLKCKGLASITIPDGVTVIGDNAFSGCTNLTDVVIPSGVIRIGKNAFDECESLTEITIPDSVIQIDENAFRACKGLTSVTLGSGMSVISKNLFMYCSGLTEITIPNSVTRIESDAFGGTGLTHVTIPDSVTTMLSPVFVNCKNLISVHLGKGITSIDNSEFMNCINLTEVFVTENMRNIGSTAFSDCSMNYGVYDGCKYLGNEQNPYLILVAPIATGIVSCQVHPDTKIINSYAFSDCSLLTSITIPEGVTVIGSGAFAYCKELTDITIPDSVTTLGGDAFRWCTRLASVTIGNGVTQIYDGTFEKCEALINISLGEGIIQINRTAFSDSPVIYKVYENGYYLGNEQNPHLILMKPISYADSYQIHPDTKVISGNAFKGYLSMTGISIPKGLIAIGDFAFYECEGLPSITIPSSVTYIGERAFYGCAKLTNTILPYGVTYIGDGAFYGCEQLTNIVIPDSVTHLGIAAFCYCKNLASVTLSNNITSLGSDVFAGCSSLTSIIIPDSVTSIGKQAFSDCTSLARVTIGNGVTCFETHAFYQCTALTNIRIPGSVTRNDGATFEGCTSLKIVAIEKGVPKLPGSMFKGCTSLTSIMIPETVTSIGTLAFDGCTRLSTVIFCGTPAQWNAMSILGNASKPLGNAKIQYHNYENGICTICQQYDEGFWVYRLDGNEELAQESTVYINGLPCEVKTDGEGRYLELPKAEALLLVTYTYHTGDGQDIHTQYPTGMKVYQAKDGKITYIPELDNLLQYSGASIRITGKKGIRMITSIEKEKKTALTGKGLAGYKLLEYGTALCFASEIPEGDALVLGRDFTRSNYAYKKGKADPVFATTKDLVQYTNVLVGFSLDQCKDDIAMRPYIILEDAQGNRDTLYGGTIYRSIGYIAYQNRTVFKPKTASYNYVWEIIHHVYGDKYDADYKG